jgi:hypothetical protein
VFRRWHFIVAMVAGWLCREQTSVIQYLQEENRVLREMLGKKRLRFTDPQRRRLSSLWPARIQAGATRAYAT